MVGLMAATSVPGPGSFTGGLTATGSFGGGFFGSFGRGAVFGPMTT